jgi:hypothetical protein
MTVKKGLATKRPSTPPPQKFSTARHPSLLFATIPNFPTIFSASELMISGYVSKRIKVINLLLSGMIYMNKSQ